MEYENYYLYRISPKPNLSFKQLMTIGNLDPYGQHQALWRLFDLPRNEKKEKAEFLFRCEVDNSIKLPVFYVLTCKQQPRDRDGIWDIIAKKYNPDIRQGDRFEFKVRVNPVLKRKPAEPDPNTNKRQRHDVVMEAKTKLKNEKTPREKWPHINEIVHKAGMEWLRKRCAENGFECFCDGSGENIRVDGYQTYQFYKKGARVRFSTLDFYGRLTVADPVRFKKILFEGLGPSKGFGCGLMLIKRA